MAEKLLSSIDVDIVLPDGQVPHSGAPLPALVTEPFMVPSVPAFDADSTTHFQSKMTKAPEWFCSMVASNSREKRRFASELVHIKGAWPLLMKQRNGGKWTADEKTRLKTMVRSASNVSPYLFIWAIPGSMLLLPFLAWFLDKRRKNKSRRTS